MSIIQSTVLNKCFCAFVCLWMTASTFVCLSVMDINYVVPVNNLGWNWIIEESFMKWVKKPLESFNSVRSSQQIWLLPTVAPLYLFLLGWFTEDIPLVRRVYTKAMIWSSNRLWYIVYRCTLETVRAISLYMNLQFNIVKLWAKGEERRVLVAKITASSQCKLIISSKLMN